MNMTACTTFANGSGKSIFPASGSVRASVEG